MKQTRRLTLALVACAMCVTGVPADEAARPEPVRTAHDFSFEDINPASPSYGKRLKLSELYADEGVVVTFMASWCSPCWREAPDLQKLHAAGETRIIGMAADEYGAPIEPFLGLVEHHELTLPILFVPEEQATALERHYDHAMLPATYLIGSDGGIRRVFEGLVSPERLRQEIGAGLGR